MTKNNEEDEDPGLIDNILKGIPLKTRLEVFLSMRDVDNWDNGSYKGKAYEMVPEILEIVNGWIKDGMPQKL